MFDDIPVLKNFFSQVPSGEKDRKEIEIDVLKVRGKTLVFGNSVYYIPNISKVEVYDLSTTKPIPWYFWLLLFVGFLLLFILREAFWGIVVLAIAGVVFYIYWRKKREERYGLEITLNAGSSTVMISSYLDFLKQVALVLYNIMNEEEDKSINFNFDQRKIVDIGGNVSGSTIVAGSTVGDIVNSI